MIEVSGSVAFHYHLEAYICGAGCVKPSPFEGWATFTQIYQQRPDRCRFAVAQMVRLIRPTRHAMSVVVDGQPTGDYLVWDLYDNALLHARTTTAGMISPPAPLWRGASLDGMIMKAMALYDKGRE